MSKSPFEVPGEMRDLASRSVEQARRAFETFIGAAQKASDAVNASGHPLRHMAEASRMTVAFAERNMNAAFDMAERLVQAKTIEEAMKIQSDFMQEQAQTLRSQMEEAGQSVRQQFDTTTAQVRESMDQAMAEGSKAQETVQKAVSEMATPPAVKPKAPRKTRT